MENINRPDIIEKIKQQFETGPYPRKSLEESPNTDYNFLFIHSLITAFYLRNRTVINTEGKVILDAGCGSGYKALALAEANPGARIVGIDFSEQSVKLAQKRLEYHGFNNTEFHAISIEELPILGQKFDYINCDDVLYLLPDLQTGLKTLKSVLKPKGIIRGNLHSRLQRDTFYRAQSAFKMMGLMNDNPGELEISIVRDLMKSLKTSVYLKKYTWKQNREDDEEFYLANYLLQGDTGYTIPELFAALKAANLEFVSMVNWRHWDISDLFDEPDNLPAFIAMSLPELDEEQRLHLFELFHPVHRLLDFWCAHPSEADSFTPIEQWSDTDWRTARVYLHPQIASDKLRQDLLKAISCHQPCEISRYVPSPTMVPLRISATVGACLLPLWEEPQSVQSLVERWLKLRPVDLVTLESVSEQRAFEEVKDFLSDLEVFLYVLLQRSEPSP
ncbi:MAG: methyltransferase domain-containing protein [Cyanobacteria bacterium J007]|nr:MAG: methyltransferase domain-containing protein [Cyanobacteria bacterium J007]